MSSENALQEKPTQPAATEEKELKTTSTSALPRKKPRARTSMWIPKGKVAQQLEYKNKVITQPQQPPAVNVVYSIEIPTPPVKETKEKPTRAKRKASELSTPSTSAPPRAGGSKSQDVMSTKAEGAKRRKAETTKKKEGPSVIQKMRARCAAESAARRSIIEPPRERVLKSIWHDSKETREVPPSRPIAPLPARAKVQKKSEMGSASISASASESQPRNAAGTYRKMPLYK